MSRPQMEDGPMHRGGGPRPGIRRTIGEPPPEMQQARQRGPSEAVRRVVVDPKVDEIVVPIRTEVRVRVGPKFYDFFVAQPIAVPKETVPHLRRVGILAPQYETNPGDRVQYEYATE